MTISAKKHSSTMTLALEGRLDTNTAPQLEKEIDGLTEDVKELILDLDKLEYISSAGLRVLLASHKKMSAAGGSMRVLNVCDDVMEVFDMTGFNVLLNIG